MMDNVRIEIDKSTEEVLIQIIDGLTDKVQDKINDIRPYLDKIEKLDTGYDRINTKIDEILLKQNILLEKQDKISEYINKPWWRKIF